MLIQNIEDASWSETPLCAEVCGVVFGERMCVCRGSMLLRVAVVGLVLRVVWCVEVQEPLRTPRLLCVVMRRVLADVLSRTRLLC